MDQLHNKMTSDLTIRQCTPDDIDILKALCRTTFWETFGADNTEENLEAMFEESFNDAVLKKEILDEHSHICLLFFDNEAAAFIKVNDHKSQTEDMGTEYVELQRIYILQKYQGKGLGRVLMDKVHDIAQSYGRKKIWLGVWEHNQKAIDFYKKFGFEITGDHSFFVGDDEQRDYIMEKVIT